MSQTLEQLWALTGCLAGARRAGRRSATEAMAALAGRGVNKARLNGLGSWKERPMLEKIPHGVGHALRGIRAGFDKIASEDRVFANIVDEIALSSPAFEDGGSIPPRYTADGEGISPPLSWRGVPSDAVAVALLVEDPDAPTPEPLVHLLAWDLPPDLAALPEGQLRSAGHEGLDENLGRNSFLQAAWLAPDPPTGHGPHLYVFQIFALDRRLDLEGHPGRGALLKSLEGHVLAKGVLVGTYERP